MAPTPRPEPDGPEPFGYKATWIAARTSDPQRVAEALGLRDLRISSWRDGLAAAYGAQVFVTPPLSGWVLAVGATLPASNGEGTPDTHLPWFQALAGRFPEVQYFSTHRVVEWHAWAKAVNGVIVRRYAWLGEQGCSIWDDGTPTPEEAKLGLKFPVDLDSATCPDEDHVLAMARAWSIDPGRIDQLDLPPSLGLVGTPKD